jgi:hypothetical protein
VVGSVTGAGPGGVTVLRPGQPHQHQPESKFEKEVSGVFHAISQKAAGHG